LVPHFDFLVKHNTRIQAGAPQVRALAPRRGEPGGGAPLQPLETTAFYIVLDSPMGGSGARRGLDVTHVMFSQYEQTKLTSRRHIPHTKYLGNFGRCDAIRA